MITRLGYFLRETMVSLRRNLLMTVAGILTVAVSLALFGGVLLLSKWVDHGTERIKGGVRLEIFMVVKASDDQVSSVRSQLESDRDIKSFKYFDKKAALREFKRLFHNDPDLVQNITAEALPESFRIVPTKAEKTTIVQRRYEHEPGVDKVATPAEALQGLLDATRVTRLIFIGLSLILLGSSVFLIVNTIRLATFARRREIEVMKLVGASNWFVRVPFLAEGIIQGLVGAGLAVGAVFALKVFVFSGQLEDAGDFFSSFYVTSANTLSISFWVCLIGIAIGFFGSLIGLRRFLRV
jgi:cell division transport system permease protein